MPTWSEITQDPRYIGLSEAGKEATRAAYLAKNPKATDAPPAPVDKQSARDEAMKPRTQPMPGEANYDEGNGVSDDLMYLKDQAVRGIGDLGHFVAQNVGDAIPGTRIQRAVNAVNAQPGLSNLVTGQAPKPEPTLVDQLGGAADKAISAAENAVTDATRKPSSEGVELAGKGVRFAAPSLLGPAGTVAKLAKAGKMAEAGMAALKALGLAGVEGAGAAEGGEAGKSIAESAGASPETGEMVGQMVGGGLAGIVSPAVLAKYPKTISGLSTAAGREKMLGGIQGELAPHVEQAVKDRIAQGIRDAGPQAEVDLARADELKKAIPGYNPNLGQATGAAGIIADQQAAIAASSKAFDAARNAEKSNAEALSNYLKTGKEEGERMTPKSYLDQAVQDDVATQAEVEARAQQLRDKARARVGALESETQPAAAGAAIKGEFGAVKEGLDQQRNALYKEAADTAKDEGAKYSMTPLADTIRSAAKDPYFEFSPQDMPELQRTLAGMANKADEAAAEAKLLDANGNPLKASASAESLEGKSYEEMSTLMRAAREDQRNVWKNENLSPAQKKAKSDVLDRVIQSVNEQITHNPDAPETAARHLAADQFYRDEYAPRVRRGETAVLTKEDKNGVPRVLNQDVVNHYTSSAEGAKQFVTTFGKGSKALEPVVEHIRDKYRQEVLNKFVDAEGHLTLRPQDAPAGVARMTGEKSEKALIDAHDKWMRKNGAVIDELDKGGANLRKDLGTVHDSISSIGRDQFMTAMNRQQLDADELGKLLRTNANHVDGIVETALKDPEAMGRLTAKLSTLSPMANKTLARSVMNKIADTIRVEPGEIGVNPDKMAKMLKENRESLQTLFKAAYGHTEGMRHFAKLTDVFDALKMQARALPKQSLTATSIGQDPLRQHVGFGSRTLFNVVRAVTGGRTSKFDAFLALGGQAGAHQLAKTYNRIQQEILSDPEKTKELMKLIKMEQQGVSLKERSQQAMKIMSMGKRAIGYYVGSKYIPKLMRFYGPAAVANLGNPHDQDKQQ